MEFLLISLACLILLLGILWRPFFKQYSHNSTTDDVDMKLREQTNIDLYHEHKKEIERDYADGGIDEENYQFLLAELDNTLLQDIENNQSEAESVQSQGSEKLLSIVWPVSLSLFILIFAFAVYQNQGTFEKLTQMPPQDSQHQAMSSEEAQQQRHQQAIAYIKELQEHLEKEPQDSEAWYNLGQAYISVADFDAAIAAVDEVIKIEGEHADLVGVKAQASYYRNNQQIDEQVQQYIDKALALDPQDPSTNILLGMHNFIETNYQQAIKHWQLVIDANKPGVNIEALKEAIAEANKRSGMPSSMQAEVAGPKLSINVELSTNIAQELANGNDKVVFVYAIPTDGRRMPLAAVKLMASDLPKVVVLNNQQAMTPESNLSSVERVHVYAVVSNQGGAGIKPGDFKGELLDLDVNNTDTIKLRIDKLVE
ncbi:c-type cytochrome biogenesis protein CcmI [Colwellia sp. RSH04]|uniref:c-type cytochrome biogenesis protein CcmI n=1 Tax=Colwellia sp. RSH04 TaxID=2305464 RepID=UPI000E581028|nr:c-type cytochrome biogenesis protein CcmI [Colwellia sp. RSH04]RHW77528.1 c-type cytochrome biogenesis protein CcmI [Colwellia sp. RSH04]